MIETITMCMGTGCMLADDCAFYHEMLRHKVSDPGQPLYIDASECVARRNNLYLKDTRVFSRRTYRFSEPATVSIQERITVRNVCHAPITDREALPADSPFFAVLEEALAHGIEMSVSNGDELTPVAFHWEQPDGQHSQCCTAEVAAEVLQAIIDKLKKGGVQ